MKSLFLFSALTFITTNTFASSAVGVVKVIRGQAVLLAGGSSRKLVIDDTVKEGETVKTEDKSFVRIVMKDKSQFNVGPKSELKIENFDGKDSSVVKLIHGQVRSIVTKDYMEIKKTDKSKILLKTNNAVLGVRGTDFLLTNMNNQTATVLFEGEIVFNNIERGERLSPRELEQIASNGVRVHPGEFSVVNATAGIPTVPSLLNVQQLEKLEKNADFESGRNPASQNDAPKRSIVPAGLSGKSAASTNSSLNSELAKSNSSDALDRSPASNSGSDAAGFVDGNSVKPANGSSLHLESGIIISPGPGAVLDPTTNTFIGSADMGAISADGSYVPPANVEITPEGKMTVISVNESGEKVKVVVTPPPPVATTTSQSLTQIAAAPQVIPSTTPTIDLTAVRPPPSGGIQGVNDPQRSATLPTIGETLVRIKVK